MNIAPIQMVSLAYRRLSVEADFDHLPKDSDGPVDPHSVLEGVDLRTDVGFSPLDETDPRGTAYFVTLRLRTSNDPKDKDAEPKFSPYLIDIEAGATIVLSEAARIRPDAQQLVYVNGPSLIWGAIREMLALMTSRMPAGTALLPSVNFHDLKRPPAEGREASNAATSAPATEATSSAKPKRPRSRKS